MTSRMVSLSEFPQQCSEVALPASAPSLVRLRDMTHQRGGPAFGWEGSLLVHEQFLFPLFDRWVSSPMEDLSPGLELYIEKLPLPFGVGVRKCLDLPQGFQASGQHLLGAPRINPCIFSSSGPLTCKPSLASRAFYHFSCPQRSPGLAPHDSFHPTGTGAGGSPQHGC